MSSIKKIIASEIINSRGYPTIAAKLILDNDYEVKTSIPSFERNFDYEPKELRDNDENRYSGRGVQKAVYYINELLSPKLIGVSPTKQIEIDNWLIKADGTKDKSKLGVNTMIAISYLVAKAGAYLENLPLFKYINKLMEKYFPPAATIEKLPSPIFPLLIGGKHGQVDLEFKEFQIIPSSSFSYSQAYQIGVDLYHLLRHTYKFNFSYNLDVIEGIKNIVNKKGYVFEHDIFLGLDISGYWFFSNGKYTLKDKIQSLSTDEYFNFIQSIIKKFSPLVITDPFANNDWLNLKKINDLYSKDIYLTADELIGSNRFQIEKIIKEKIATSIVIRPNKAGTITEALTLIDIARKNNLSIEISSDLEETNESFIADFSVGVVADFVNFGLPVHGENVSKYNRLLEIEKEIKN